MARCLEPRERKEYPYERGDCEGGRVRHALRIQRALAWWFRFPARANPGPLFFASGYLVLIVLIIVQTLPRRNMPIQGSGYRLRFSNGWFLHGEFCQRHRTHDIPFGPAEGFASSSTAPPQTRFPPPRLDGPS